MYLTIVHLINETYQVVNEETDSVLFQGSYADSQAFMSEIRGDF